MMVTRERIVSALFRAIEGVNQVLAPAQRLRADASQIIAGPSSALESMGFINLLIAAEEQLLKEFSRDLSLTALLAEQQPAEYETIGALALLIEGVLDAGDP